MIVHSYVTSHPSNSIYSYQELYSYKSYTVYKAIKSYIAVMLREKLYKSFSLKYLQGKRYKDTT